MSTKSESTYRRPPSTLPIAENDNSHGDNGKIYTHPAFGSIRINRTTGCSGQVLFGTEIAHDTTVRVEINHADERWSLGRKWFFEKKRIIELEFSPAQFAEAITGLNSLNVPCTIRYIEGPGEIERISQGYFDSMEEIRRDIKESTVKGVDKMREAIETALEVIKNSKLSKKQAEEIIEKLKSAERIVADHIPFVAQSAQEVVDKIHHEAAVEVDAMIQHRLLELGMQRMEEIRSGANSQLTEGKE